MKIDKVEIDGFGKLNNCEFTFADGVNLIFGENESGKSTLCEFILSAFYGLPNESRKVSDDITPRKKYRPWFGDAFGGRVYFTHDDGRRYVIERSFKATKRGDKAILRDAKTWEELDTADDIGEKIFGLSKDAFLKTLYVKSFGADSLKSDDGEIMSRLSNLETSGAEDVSYSKIINAMEKEIFSLKTKTGRGGKISLLQDKETSLKQELSLSKMTYVALVRDEETVKASKEQVADIEAKIESLEKKYQIAVLHEKYLQNKKVDETKKVIEERLTKSREKLQKISEQLENARQDSEQKVSADEIGKARALETKKLMAEEKVQNINNAPKQKNSIGFASIPLLTVGAFMMVYGFGKSNIYVGVLGAVLAVVSVALVFIFKNKNVKFDKIKNEELEQATQELETINEELEKILSPYGVTISDELSALFMNSKSKEEKEAELMESFNECSAEIQMLEKSIPENSDTEEFSQEVIDYSEENADVLYAKISELKADSKRLSSEVSKLELHIAKETAEVRNEAEILAELSSASEEMALLEKRYNSLTLAARWLMQAHEEIKNNFAPKLNEKASSYLALLTQDKYKDVRANDSFCLNLKAEGGEIVEAGFMSRGTYDLLYIALRLAAMNVITDGKIPPVILDDAFSQLDDTRLLSAIDLVNASPEFSQVILFTCHESYKKLVGDKNINVVSM